MEELLLLPGVGRKTANVVLGNAYGAPEGVVVDTHVGRLARRLAWSRHADPEKVERDLNALLPRGSWVFAGHALILHGRRVCSSRSPRCVACLLADCCPKVGVAAQPAPSGRRASGAGAPPAKRSARSARPARGRRASTREGR